MAQRSAFSVRRAAFSVRWAAHRPSAEMERSRRLVRRTVVGPVVVGLAVVWGWACDAPDPQPTPQEPLAVFDTIPAAILMGADTLRITAELADTGERRAYGLMERDSLPPDHGMLFVYPDPLDPASGFWMYRTLIPLDIAFLDGDGTIVAILGMAPCRSPNPDTCWRYSPDVAFQGALEMERGYLGAHGVEVGDRVTPAPADIQALH